MRIADLLKRGRPTVSFEFMAPRDEREVDALEKTISALAGNAPDWISVTYRRATGEKTLELVTRIKRQYHVESMAHLTCANTRDETRRILNWMEREGVANVLALRGDPPGPGEPFEAADVGDRSEEHTSELQSQFHLVCRLLLEKKKKKKKKMTKTADEVITRHMWNN